MKNDTKEFTAALAHHVLDLALAEAEYPENIPEKFAELWPKYRFAAGQLLFSPELAAVRIAEAAERDNNQAKN